MVTGIIGRMKYEENLSKKLKEGKHIRVLITLRQQKYDVLKQRFLIISRLACIKYNINPRKLV